MTANIFKNIPDSLPQELMEVLLSEGGIKIERIISKGHRTPENEWYDQDTHEWVVVIKGSAGLKVEGEADIVLKPGDYVYLPAHKKHRVEWTDEKSETLWLAVHIAP